MSANLMDLPPEIAAEQQRIARRRQMAEMLMKASGESSPGQSAGRYYAPQSGLSPIVRGIQAYMAAKGMKQAGDEENALVDRYQRGQASEMERIIAMRQGAPATTDAADNIERPAVAADPRRAVMEAMASRYPVIRRMGELDYSHMKKADEPFTLGGGQTRFGPDGKPIVTVPQTPKSPEPFTLAPGGTRYDAQGNVIAQSPQSPTPQVSIDMKGDSEYTKKVSGLAGERDVSQHDAAMAAQENVYKINQQLDLLRNSQAITGLGTEIFKNAERVRALFLQDKAAGKRVSDTELLDALLGQEVFPMIKQLGIGARGLDTPAEREFLRNVMTGTTPLNRETLIRLSEVRRDISERAIKRWNDRVDSGELDRYFSATGMPKKRVDVPKSKGAPNGVPTGIDPAVWAVMTPEQKALWNE